jgi:hypothetical protein
MRMTIRYQSGLRVEAVLLAANRERMRVAVDSQRDTIELHKVDACWYTEEGAGIEIESLISIAGTDVSSFCAAVYPRTNAAGRGPYVCLNSFRPEHRGRYQKEARDDPPRETGTL